MAVTLRDVARHAGVSVRTVSNVVNGFAHVSPEMRAKVQQSLEALDYRPNLLARSLRSGRTGVIALVLPDVREPYFGELAHAVIDPAREHGWTVLIEETGGDAEREAAAIDVISRSRMVDGMLLNLLALPARRLTAMTVQAPAVMLGERTHPDLDHVGIDNEAAVRAAVGHLVQQGRRRIAAIGRDAPLSGTARMRLRAYEHVLGRAGIVPDDALVPLTPRFGLAEGVAATEALLGLPDPPDALFCFNDTLALGALRVLREHGVTAGREVAVIGIDDVAQSSFSAPPLSSVSPDKDALARTAVTLLHERVSGFAGAVRRLTAPFELVVRESTWAPGGGTRRTGGGRSMRGDALVRSR